MMRSSVSSIALLVTVNFSGAVAAAPIYFSDRTQFEAAITGALSFESFEGPTYPANLGTDAIDVGGFTFSVDGGRANNNIGHFNASPGSATYRVTEGLRSLTYNSNSVNYATFDAFDSPITAFGLDIATDVGDTVNVRGGTINSDLILSAYSPLFWGVIDLAGISEVTFGALNNYRSRYYFDSVSYGQAAGLNPVPVPPAVFMFASGLLGFIGLRRKAKPTQV